MNELERRVALVKVWDAMFRGARTYVEREGFVGVHNAPELVSVTGACENVDTLFKVDFFGKQAFLAQSDQLYLELLTPHLGKVYAEIQSFRAEDVVDDRHLCQFSLFEIEHLGNLDELMRHLQGIVYSSLIQVLQDCQEEMGKLGVSLSHWQELIHIQENPSDFLGSVTYSAAVHTLKQHGFPDLEWGDDLKADHEARIVDIFGPCFITHYPKDIKFFNMRATEPDSLKRVTVNSCDLILPYAGESAGAAEREHKYETIVERLKSSNMYKTLKAQGVKDEDFDWYLDAHKDKHIPLHSGAGIGMARVAQFILGYTDIRQAVPFLINKDNLL